MLHSLKALVVVWERRPDYASNLVWILVMAVVSKSEFFSRNAVSMTDWTATQG